MKFAVLGGDVRSALLCALLEKDGHKVHTYCLEKAALPPEIQSAGCLQAAVYGADAVLLPVPAEAGGELNAPLGAQSPDMTELVGALWPGQLLCGGRFSQSTVLMAVQEGLHVTDLMARRDFVVSNAAITAEGAVHKLMDASRRALLGCHVLITGYGRIARLLAPRLRGLGAYVSITARSPADRAMAEALGLGCVSFEGLRLLIEDVDFLVNTVPDRVIDRELMSLMKKDALLLELASAPGGFDREDAKELGLEAIFAPGLPGTYAPLSAAELLRDSVYAIISEQEG